MRKFLIFLVCLLPFLAMSDTGPVLDMAVNIGVEDVGNFFIGDELESVTQELANGTALDDRYVNLDGESVDITNGTFNLTTTGNLTAGNLTMSSGSIVDTSGNITFVDNNLTTTGKAGIGAAVDATGALHIRNALGALPIKMSNNDTDDSSQVGGMRLRHYDVDATDFDMFVGSSTVTANSIFLGGGGAGNSATNISFWTGATTKTTYGTKRLEIDSSGDFDFQTGNLTTTGTFTMGSDGTGADVKFFGTTSGKYMLWDESEDTLIVEGGIAFSQVDHDAAGADKTIDWGASNKQEITLSANCIITFTAPHGVANLVLKIVQDATGSRTITWPTTQWPGGTAPTLSTAANAIDIVSFYCDGTNYFGQASLNFSAP